MFHVFFAPFFHQKFCQSQGTSSVSGTASSSEIPGTGQRLEMEIDMGFCGVSKVYIPPRKLT